MKGLLLFYYFILLQTIFSILLDEQKVFLIFYRTKVLLRGASPPFQERPLSASPTRKKGPIKSSSNVFDNISLIKFSLAGGWTKYVAIKSVKCDKNVKCEMWHKCEMWNVTQKIQYIIKWKVAAQNGSKCQIFTQLRIHCSWWWSSSVLSSSSPPPFALSSSSSAPW